MICHHAALVLLVLSVSMAMQVRASEPSPLQVATFRCDVTPPLGSPLCEGGVEPAREIADPLSARGLVLVGAGQPIVLCAVDWVGIANASYDLWRAELAKAAGTDVSHVAVHALHQHDAPGWDASAEELLATIGLRGATCDHEFSHRALADTAAAVKDAMANLQPVTHLGVGSARVERVASNRRLLGPDGRVQHVRFSSCRDEAVRAWPEGAIDPLVRVLSLWQDDRPLVVLSYYATHPQSYYGQGQVSADFVGLARNQREASLPGVPHVHFNGAGGNVAAGKYNDGSPERRPELAGRLADGMRRAWEATARRPIGAAEVGWSIAPVTLPLRTPVGDVTALNKLLQDANAPAGARMRAARDLAFARHGQTAGPLELTCLRLAPDVRVLHMPGELFVEYQLAASLMAPGATVCMAAYGDYGAGYIGTRESYDQGGYETGPVSRTAPEVEEVLLKAIAQLLGA